MAARWAVLAAVLLLAAPCLASIALVDYGLGDVDGYVAAFGDFDSDRM